MKKALTLIALAAAALAAALPAAAQKVTEVNFYYPVAVGGPVTKTIDQMAADFGKENPDIKVNPIYSGTYQESIVKVLTATKSGKPPQLAVLLDRRWNVASSARCWMLSRVGASSAFSKIEACGFVQP